MTPNGKEDWFRLIALIIAIGIIRASIHFIKIVTLSLLGLAGLWMVHKLAEDYNKIRKTVMVVRSFFSKRSISDNDYPSMHNNMTKNFYLNWNNILKQDPKECVQSLACQLATTSEDKYSSDEAKIMNFIEFWQNQNMWSSKKMREATDIGFSTSNVTMCLQKFEKCKLSKDNLMIIIRSFES